MKTTVRPFVSNNMGSVLAVAMYTLLLLSIIGMAAIHTANVELQISGNNQQMVEDFYFVEGALITTLERTDWWLSDDFLEGDTTSAKWAAKVDFDEDTIDDAMVEIRCVEKNTAIIATLSEAANDIPSDLHAAPPPIESGYSVRHFYTRKYAVTATGLRSNTQLQSGAWKVFNKY